MSTFTVPPATAHNWRALLQEMVDEMGAAIAAAGTGTATVEIGTQAQRLAYATPYDGLLWIETDNHRVYKYSTSLASWVLIGAELGTVLLTFLAAASLADARTALGVLSATEIAALDQAVAAGVLASGPSRVTNGGALVAQQPAANAANTWTHGPVDMWQIKADYTTVSAGTLAQGTAAGSLSGKWVKAAGLSASSGNQQVLFRTAIPAGRCKDLASQTIALILKAMHDVGSAVDVSVRVYSADVEDDFSAVTLIGTVVDAESVASGVATALEGTLSVSAAAANGLLVEVVFDVNADVTTKNFYISDLTLVRGGNPQSFNTDYPNELRNCRAFYAVYAGGLSGATVGTTKVRIGVPCQMYAAPSLVLLNTSPTLIFVNETSWYTSASGSGSSITNGTTSKNGAYFEMDGFTGLQAATVLSCASTDLIALDARLL